MKLFFPSKVYQFITVLLLSVLINMPFFVLQIKYEFLNEGQFAMLFFILIFIVSICIFSFINKKRGHKVALKIKFNYNDRPILVWSSLAIFAIHALYLLTHVVINNSFELTEFNLILFLGATISAPVLEELVFRHFFLTGLLITHKPLSAIVINTLVFGLIHIQPSQVFIGLLFGLIFSTAYYRTRSIGLCIVLHLLANVTALILPYIYKMLHFDGTNFINYILLIILPLTLLIGSIRKLYFQVISP